MATPRLVPEARTPERVYKILNPNILAGKGSDCQGPDHCVRSRLTVLYRRFRVYKFVSFISFESPNPVESHLMAGQLIKVDDIA